MAGLIQSFYALSAWQCGATGDGSRPRQVVAAVGSLIALSLFAAAPALAADAAAPRVDYGRQVQPILAKSCYRCHGPDVAEGGLRLSDRKTVYNPLESGEVAVVPGKPDQSELLRRIRTHDEDERMPPEGKPLTESQVELVQQWILEGANWEEHWAFQPLARPEVPAVQQQEWVRTPIDAFILRDLEIAGMQPNPQADRVTLIRRAYYDLTGLPPSPAEVAEFVNDPSPQAWEQLIDRLLASPRYGERWGRHWLDLVRYADTNSFERDGKKPHAWRYRDHVIDSLNADKPYDQFVREQLAGDEFPQPTRESLIATGFYRLGLWDDEPADRELARYDGYDDLVATTGQVFLGLTVNCARCHDHKIDPISQKEYYSLVSFFRNTTPMGNGGPQIERPLFRDATEEADFQRRQRELEAERNRVQAEVTAVEQQFRQQFAAAATARDLDDLEYKFYRDRWQKLPNFDELKAEESGKLPRGLFDISPATREDNFGFVYSGYLIVPQDGEYTFILDSDDGSRILVNGEKIVEHDGIHGEGNPQKATVKLAAGRLPIRLEYFQGVFGKGLTVEWSGPGVEQRYLSAVAQNDPKESKKSLQDQINAHGERVLGKEAFAKYRDLVRELRRLKETKADVEMALCISEHGREPQDTFVLIRGNPGSHGDKVEPGFPSIFESPKPVIPPAAKDAKTTGRRTVLADWITSKDNRLTARVLVNRLWQHHFGRGIVRSTNNFGLLGDRPTHPALLDWLANDLMDGGWRLKRLHKLIMLSSVYQMSSRANPAYLAKDPINDRFWRFDMRRLSAEEIRDSIFAVNGKLNLKMYGPGTTPEISAEVLAGQSRPGEGWGKASPDEAARRAIYIHVKRSLIVPILADFDFADTDSSCAARFATTQPGQALGMLNGKLLHDESGALAARLMKEAGSDRRNQVRLAYWLALQREPHESDIGRGVELIQKLETERKIAPQEALRYFCLMVYNLNEFIYLD